MHVQTLTLTNVRQFEHESFNFKPGFNLLVGENGAGKTTLLRALLAVTGELHAGRRPALYDEDIRLKFDSLKITARIFEERSGEFELNYEKRIHQRARRSKGLPAPMVLFYGSHDAGANSFTARKIPRYSPKDAPKDCMAAAEVILGMVSDPDLQFGPSDEVRKFVTEALSRISPGFRDFRWIFEPRNCYVVSKADTTLSPPATAKIRRDLASALKRHFSENPNPFSQRDCTGLLIESSGVLLGEESAGAIVPKFSDLLKYHGSDTDILQYIASCQAVVRITPQILVNSEHGDFSLNQLSDGQQRLFALLIDIARRLLVRSSNEQIREVSAIILIDEIDVHLHPKWQRKIVPMLEDLFPRCQFIATTHSPFVIQAADRQKILRLGKADQFPLDGDANSIEDIVEEIQGVTMPQRSLRAEQLSNAAKRYFTLLRRGPDAPAQELRDAEKQYREASEPFASQPALNALLNIERLEKR